MRRQPRPKPERPHLVAADALVAEAQLRYLGEQRRHRPRLDEINLERDELRQRLTVDPVLHATSLLLS